MGDAEDTDLVLRVRSGDTDAFETLYRRHADAVRRTVAANVRQQDRVDDAVQETFLRALEKLSSLRDPERVGPWLKTIARNIATDRLRERVASDIDAAPEQAEASREVSAETLAEVRELAHLVRGAMTELSPRDLRAVAMAGYLDATPSEIADALGVSVGAAKVVLHRARRRLRTALKLELLVRRRGSACVEFSALADADQLAAAATHLGRCEACQSAGSAELRLYDASALTAAVTAFALIRAGDEERRIPIASRLVIGRDCADVPAGERLVFDDAEVSRRHVELKYDRGRSQLVAIDTSTNGTLVNGVRITRGQPWVLLSGDVVSVGGSDIEVRVASQSAPDTPTAPTTMRRIVDSEMIMIVGDIVSYTAFAERSGAASVGTLVDDLFAELYALLRTYRGTLANIAGDALFAVWSAEEDADAPVLALDYALVASDLVKAFTPRDSAAVEMGWAITAGRGAAGMFANAVATVVGDAANVAFRLSGLAGRDGEATILVTTDVSARVGDAFRFGPPRETSVKGRAAPVVFVPLLRDVVKVESP